MACNMFSVAGQLSIVRIPAMRIDQPHVQMHSFITQNRGLNVKGSVCIRTSKVFCNPPSLEEEFSAIKSHNLSKNEESDLETLPKDTVEQLPTNEETKVLLADSQRIALLKKLNDANQRNRFLIRQLQVKENELVDFKIKLAVIQHEVQVLASLAEEVANYDISEGSRIIGGNYIQSHLLSRLEAVQKRFEKQTGVDIAKSQEVDLIWHGMAESVRVMGSFDGWSEGEYLSPDCNGSFSTTLMLTPGRYEMKFLVDGEWKVSNAFPTIGEGMMTNNVLIVE